MSIDYAAWLCVSYKLGKYVFLDLQVINKTSVKISLGMDSSGITKGSTCKVAGAQGSSTFRLLVHPAMSPHEDCISPVLKRYHETLLVAIS